MGDYIDKHNDNPKPFVWTAKASDILEKVKRARAVLDNCWSACRRPRAAASGLSRKYREPHLAGVRSPPQRGRGTPERAGTS
jgi:hypothetical protein